MIFTPGSATVLFLFSKPWKKYILTTFFWNNNPQRIELKGKYNNRKFLDEKLIIYPDGSALTYQSELVSKLQVTTLSFIKLETLLRSYHIVQERPNQKQINKLNSNQITSTPYGSVRSLVF